MTISKNYHLIINLKTICFVIITNLSLVFTNDGKYDRKLTSKGKYIFDTSGMYMHDNLGYYIRDDRGIYRPDGKGFYTLNGEGKYTWNGTDFINVTGEFGINTATETSRSKLVYNKWNYTIPLDFKIPKVDYKYDILTKDGIRLKQIGGYVTLSNNEKILRVKGSYSYPSDGKTYKVDYVSDEKGFRVTGTNISTPQFVKIDTDLDF